MIGSVVRSSWPPPKGPDLGRSSAGPHQGAAVLQILCVNFYDKCLRKVMHIDFHLGFFVGLKGHMCQTVMYLVWSPPDRFFFFLVPILLIVSTINVFFYSKRFRGFFFLLSLCLLSHGIQIRMNVLTHCSSNIAHNL